MVINICSVVSIHMSGVMSVLVVSVSNRYYVRVTHNITSIINISISNIGISIQSIVLSSTTAMHVQAEQNIAEGTINAQCLITKALGRATEITGLGCESVIW